MRYSNTPIPQYLNISISQPNIIRDGTSQAQRLLAAFQPGYVGLDERSISDWLRFAQAYAKELNFYNANNEVAGDWSGFLPGEQEELVAYLENPEGRLEHAQQMAAHSDPKTTRLYDRRSDEVSMDEVERIGI